MKSSALALIIAMSSICVGCGGSADAQTAALGGTTWQIDFGKGVTGTQFIFCKSGFWEIVPANSRSIGAKGKSWNVKGSALTTVNADDGQVENWKMTRRGALLEISDGSQTLILHPGPATPC